MKKHIGYVDVAGWGSARHAREVRQGSRPGILRAIRALLRAGVVVVADTARGRRRIVQAGNLLVTRMEKA